MNVRRPYSIFDFCLSFFLILSFNTAYNLLLSAFADIVYVFIALASIKFIQFSKSTTTWLLKSGKLIFPLWFQGTDRLQEKFVSRSLFTRLWFKYYVFFLLGDKISLLLDEAATLTLPSWVRSWERDKLRPERIFNRDICICLLLVFLADGFDREADWRIEEVPANVLWYCFSSTLPLLFRFILLG